MGRYYYGTITGKFWFGIQLSNDASHFKPSDYTPTQNYSYFSCGCYVEDINELYCTNCFSDYSSHLNMLDECDLQVVKTDTDNKNYILAYSNNYVNYVFDKTELNNIKDKLNELQYEIGEEIITKLNYTIDIENQYEYTINDYILMNINDETKKELLARWCLGKQIETALINEDICNFDCEY